MSESIEAKKKRLAYYDRIADDLLRRGDAAGGRSALGKRLLRQCRRYRLKAKALREMISEDAL